MPRKQICWKRPGQDTCHKTGPFCDNASYTTALISNSTVKRSKEAINTLYLLFGGITWTILQFRAHQHKRENPLDSTKLVKDWCISQIYGNKLFKIDGKKHTNMAPKCCQIVPRKGKLEVLLSKLTARQ